MGPGRRSNPQFLCVQRPRSPLWRGTRCLKPGLTLLRETNRRWASAVLAGFPACSLAGFRPGRRAGGLPAWTPRRCSYKNVRRRRPPCSARYPLLWGQPSIGEFGWGGTPVIRQRRCPEAVLSVNRNHALEKQVKRTVDVATLSTGPKCESMA